jgi:hypothetical protein
MLVLLFFMTIGLFLHAFLLHLVAGFVLEESRYFSAVIAVGIVWLVEIPMGLFHLWEPIAIALGVLTAFGALKVAYGASTARTIGLMLVLVLIGVAIFAVLIFSGLLLSFTN